MTTSYFQTVKRSYKDVPITEQGIDTPAFLEATEGLVKLFDVLGSAAFKVVQSDLTANIEKIRTRFLETPTKSATLEELVKNELAEKKSKATQGLLWLTRGLHFTSLALRRSLDNPGEELSVSFSKAYEGSLKPYHSFVIKPVFALAMKACPYREDFYTKLGSPRDVMLQDLEAWLRALEKIVKQIQDFYASGNYGKGL